MIPDYLTKPASFKSPSGYNESSPSATQWQLTGEGYLCEGSSLACEGSKSPNHMNTSHSDPLHTLCWLQCDALSHFHQVFMVACSTLLTSSLVPHVLIHKCSVTNARSQQKSPPTSYYRCLHRFHLIPMPLPLISFICRLLRSILICPQSASCTSHRLLRLSVQYKGS